MKTNYDIKPFLELGAGLHLDLREGRLDEVIERSIRENGWFTQSSVHMAIEAICRDMLTREALESWLESYRSQPLPASKRVGVVMAGNIPLVGFADLMCVLLCGHTAWVKPSSKDRVLTEYICQRLQQIEPSLRIEPLGERTPDAVIATGSDATRRHFEQRYAGIPALLRGSRHSVAWLTGTETPEQLDGLNADLFAYFGLGCRNVSHLFIPRHYPLVALTERLGQKPVNHAKYLNAYRQAKAVLRLSGQPFEDGGFFLLCAGEPSIQAASVLGYTRYDDPQAVTRWIAAHDGQIQCIVTDKLTEHPRRVGFGRAQHPRPEEYADGVDVMEFLLRL